MKKLSKTLAILMIFTLSLTLVTGCGSKSSVNPDEAQKSGSKEQTDKASSKEEQSKKDPLVIWSGKDYDQLVKDAEKFTEITGRRVTVEKVGWNETMNKIQTSVPTGTGPDIFWRANFDTGFLAKANMITPVDDLLGETLNEISKEALEGFTYNGKVYGLPMNIEVILMWYNKKLVPEAPKTWDELIKVSEEFNKKEGYVGGYFGAAHYLTILGYITPYGGYVFKKTADGYDVNDIGVNTPEAKKGVELALSTFKYTQRLPAGEMDTKFQEGKSPFHINGTWMAEQYYKVDKENENLEIGTAPVPELPGGVKQTNMLQITGLYVSSKTKDKNACAEFLKFMATKEVQLEHVITYGTPPARKDAADEAAKNTEIPHVKTAWEILPNTYLLPNAPEWQAYMQPSKVIASGILKEDADAGSLLADLEQGIKQGIVDMGK